MDIEENESDIFEYESQSSRISYHSEDFISQPKSSQDGTVPINILEFDYSFGYDCRKRFNLCVADPNTLIFGSGNLIHFFNVSEDTMTFRRCSTGGGIGHITKNPRFNHVAIGENGIDPPIIIYEWPSMEIITVLRAGTTRSYSHLRYSLDGLELVSQGGDPDYLITVWDWQRSKIKLQCKSHGQDVYNVIFSATIPGHMTSCGAGHIKCWKMSTTFTGLKLQGELGRFGQTEISDIVGVYPMPDEKIISGCEWGNILVWNEGLIKIEVCRKKRRPCHYNYISQFEYINGELISVGADGTIRVWYYETIDQAEPTEDSHHIEVEPIYEFIIGEESEDDTPPNVTMLMQILKQHPDDPTCNLWYAQDGNGGIWLIDLSTMDVPKVPKKLLTCHAGLITDMEVADWAPYAATIGEGGNFHIYNYHKKSLLLTYHFQDIGCCVLWLPCSVEPSGSTLVCAFKSGVIRVVSIDLKLAAKKSTSKEIVKITQVLKPHTEAITRISINPTHKILVTGSEDATIFTFHINVVDSYPILEPIGYVETFSGVSFMTWKPNHPTTIFVGCVRGDCVQVELPVEPQPYTTISYKLTECQPIIFKFQSVKSVILREEARLDFERQKQLKIAAKWEELRQLRENNPGIDIDEQLFLEEEMEAEAELPDIYIPEVPNKVLLAFYTSRDTVLLSMDGYDAGYTYEYSNPELNKETEHIRSDLIDACDNEEIWCHLFYNDRKFIIFGMKHGEIRVCRVNPENEADFSDYWILPMHDNALGYISSMRLSYDKKMLLTTGYDGNIFSFFINPDSPVPAVTIPTAESTTKIPTVEVTDIEDLNYPSIDQVVVRAEENRVMVKAKEEKDKTLAKLRQLSEQYTVILRRNNNLPPSQKLSDEELELDPRITEDLNERLKIEMDLVYKKLEYHMEKCKLRLKKLMDHFIEPITSLPFVVKRILKPETMVYSLRELKLTGDYAVDRLDIPTKLSEQIADGDEQSLEEEHDFASTLMSLKLDDPLDLDEEEKGEGLSPKIQGMESFLKGLSPETVQFELSDEIVQMLKKYRSLKAKLQEQEHDWKILQAQKPDPKAINPEDENAIETAKNTIGDYKLKASLNLDDNIEKRPTVVKKYKQIIECRRRIHFRREDYNDKLRNMRKRKTELLNEVEYLIRKLEKIHTELPQQLVKPLPSPPVIDYEAEFPEKNLEIETYASLMERTRQSLIRRKSLESEAMLKLPVDDFDEEYEVLMMDESLFRVKRTSHITAGETRRKMTEEVKYARSTVSAEALAAIEAEEKVDSKLERDMKRIRAARVNHEQDQILAYIHKCYETFDEELNELEKERLVIIHESVYMDLYLITMHQELIVLKRFENMENELSEKVDDRMKKKAVVTSKIQKSMNKIEEKNHHISKLQEKIKENTARYLRSIIEDKFYVFLKRVCKKKYKAAKKDDASESESSSESSSEDDEDDDDSDDSRKVALLHLDENILPEGCDRDVYDEAFIVREKRYEMENRIRDELKSVEMLQKEQDVQRKKLRNIEAELQTDREKLEAFLREKQRQLNDIDITVILRLHQLQCFTDGNVSERIQNCIVFDKDKLSQLYMRVGELQHETANLLEKHKSNKLHLRKMKSDCESMRKELQALKEQIKTEMEQKFGQQVHLLSLYEAVLRRLIYDIKANTSSLIKYYEEKITSVRNEYRQQLEMLKDLIQDNTEKLSFLTVLEEELLKLRKTLNK